MAELIARTRIATLLLILLPGLASSQGLFSRFDSILVTEGIDTLALGWAGGFNSVSVQNIDLDGQGGEDIILLDRSGKLLTLVKTGPAGDITYEHRPELQAAFPPLKLWVITKDYNCDGKKDLFTYGLGSISLYKNTSSGGNLSFQHITSSINSYQPPNTFPIYSGSVDLPTIVDVDKDGDLDILVFNIGGITVDFHRNESMDMYGHCDSLVFALETSCWGKFEEGASSNFIALGACNKSLGSRHSGSTLLAFDEDGDMDEDLLLGDVNDSGLVFLRNGGSPQMASMDSAYYQFPFYTTEASVERFVAPMLADIDGNGRLDFLASPFTVNSSANHKSLLYFDHNGNQSSYFNFVKNNLFQDEMLEFGEGSYPSFFDYDRDGDADLLIGNYGYYNGMGSYSGRIALLENTGSNTLPEYNLVTRDFAGLSQLNLRNMYPAFGDLDGDGDEDMIIGEETGKLYYFENVAGGSAPANFSLVQSAYGGIDVGNFATPVLADMNRDGKLDLVIGEANGTFNYIPNSGASTAPYHLSSAMAANFGGVSVATQGFTIGYSTPALVEENGRWLMFSGSEKGNIYLFDNIENNLGGTFSLTNGNYSSIWEGTRSSPAFFQAAPGNLFGIIGSYRGGVSMYKGSSFVSVDEAKEESLNLRLFPNPAKEYVVIELEGQSGNIQLLDLSGRTIVENKFSGRLQLDLQDVPAGTYLVCLRTLDSGTISRLIVVQ